MTQEALKKMYQLLLTEPHAPTVCAKLERIAREALAEHAMSEVQRLGQEIEPKIGCVNHDCDQCKAQPEQEPVTTVTSETGADITMSWWHEPALPIGTKLYATPPQRTLVWMTDEEIIEIAFESADRESAVIKAIDKLKEKNSV